MSIAVNCPTCGKSYNLNEKMAGKKVRCKHCADTFAVDLDPVLPVTGAAPPGTSGQFGGAPGPRPPVQVEFVDSEDLDEVAGDAPRKGDAAKEEPGSKKVWYIGGGILAAL